MRDLYQLDRPLAPATVRTATSIIGGAFAISAILTLIVGLMVLFGSTSDTGMLLPLTGLLDIMMGIGFLLAIYMIVRLLGEILMAVHRQNDRLGILSDELSSTRATPATASRAAAPVAKPTPETGHSEG